MPGGLLWVSIIALIMVCVVLLMTVVPRRRRLVAIDELSYPRLAALRRVSTAARAAGLLLGALAAVAVCFFGELGLGFTIAPAAFGVVLCLAILAGDLIAYDKARIPGAASLQRRGLPWPRSTTVVVGAGTVALGLLLTLTTTLASADDRGRAGRAYRYSVDCGPGATCQGMRTPFPGSYYTRPLALGIGVLLVVAVVTIAVLARRPRNSADEEIVRVDDLIRSRSVESVLCAVGASVGGSMFGVGAVAGLSASSAEHASLGALAAVLTVAGLALMIWSVALLVVPGSARPHGRRRAVLAGGRG